MAKTSVEHKPSDLISLFNQIFITTENTELVLGGSEPMYLPADANNRHHRVIFAHGFFASALHEIAHWCIAGKQRRLEVDYGYWYEPDGRSMHTQALFAQVEAKPQAVEWVLARACSKHFYVSLDNVDAALDDFSEFKDAIFDELQTMRNSDLPPRAKLLQQQLAQFYGQPLDWRQYTCDRRDLD